MKPIMGQQAVCEFGVCRVVGINDDYVCVKLFSHGASGAYKNFPLSEIKLVAINYQEPFLDLNDEELHFIMERIEINLLSDDDYDDLLRDSIIQKINSFKESE